MFDADGIFGRGGFAFVLSTDISTSIQKMSARIDGTVYILIFEHGFLRASQAETTSISTARNRAMNWFGVQS